MVNLMDYLILSSVVFLLGMMGLVINRKNLILLFMCVELMLLAVNINFVAIAHFMHAMVGELFVFFILTVAAAEAAIGLAILVLIYRARGDINIDQMDTLKG